MDISNENLLERPPGSRAARLQECSPLSAVTRQESSKEVERSLEMVMVNILTS